MVFRFRRRGCLWTSLVLLDVGKAIPEDTERLPSTSMGCPTSAKGFTLLADNPVLPSEVLPPLVLGECLGFAASLDCIQSHRHHRDGRDIAHAPLDLARLRDRSAPFVCTWRGHPIGI